jgi:hypothetical protein
MQAAIDEIHRQVALIEDGGRVVQETRLFDPDRNETQSMRSKGRRKDYRYFSRSGPAAAGHRRREGSSGCRAAGLPRAMQQRYAATTLPAPMPPR